MIIACPFCGETLLAHDEDHVWCDGTDESPHKQISLPITDWNRRVPHIPDRGYAEVGVKALVWYEYNHGFRSWETYGFKMYTILDVGSDGKRGLRYYLRDHAQFETLDEAKAAAQADYNARIRSALIAPPASADNGEPSKHSKFRQDALRLAATMNGEDFAGDFDPPKEDTVEALARTLAIVAAAYDWTVGPKGHILGLVSGDMGYAATGLKVDDETLALICPPIATPSPIEDVAEPSEAEIEAAAKIIDSNAFEGELQSSYWRSRRDNARDTARKVLTARRVRPSPVDEDALTSLQNEQREFARKASVETDPLLKERWSGISVGMRSVLASLQSQRKG